MSKNTTKRSLLASVFALVLCVAMLVGSTFAWFTDTATTGVNKIQSGKLDVKLMYSKDMKEWAEATDQTQLFNDNALWEPGHTEVVYLKIVNNGSLALKYETEFARNYRVTKGKNVLGNYFYVGDYLKVGTATTGAAFNSREDAWAAIAGSEKALQKGVQLTDGWTVLKAGESTDPFAVVIYMPTTVGNEANAKSKSWVSTIYDLGLEVYASIRKNRPNRFSLRRMAVGPTALESISRYTPKAAAAIRTTPSPGQGSALSFFRPARTQTTKHTTISASVFAEYAKFQIKQNDAWVDWEEAVAVWADKTGKVIINSGDFRQVGVPADHSDHFDLIYADNDATIEINGGTFQCVTPQWTLNCKDGSNAKITVKGGSFYQFDPSNANVGAGEIIVPTGYHVEQNGDWYNVVVD